MSDDLPGTRLLKLTKALGFNACKRCINLAKTMDESEAAEPGWCQINLGRLTKAIEKNARAMGKADAITDERVQKYAGSIPKVVALAVNGGVKYDLVMGALRLIQPVFLTNPEPSSNGCGGC